MCKKREAIIESLKRTGMPEDAAIATEIEIGKISLVGCTTFRDETNKRMVEIVRNSSPDDGEKVRQMARKLSEALKAEKLAQRGSQANAQRFYERLFRIR